MELLSDFEFEVREDGELYVMKYLAGEERVVIPATYDGKPVQQIGDSAFYGCKNLKRIKLPDSLEVIGRSAFNECRSLEQINFPKNLKIIDSNAFTLCKSLKEIHLPESIESIGAQAFSMCYGLEKITMDASNVKLGKKIFVQNANVKEVNFNGFKCLEISDQARLLKEFLVKWETLENQQEILSYIKKRKTLQKAIFSGDDVIMINFFIQQKMSISLPEVNQYLERAIREQHTALTAYYLAYKEEYFTREEIEQYQEAKELVEIGLEYPTIKQLKEKWKCSKVEGGIRISGYKGSNEKEVIPKQLADGTPIIMVAGSGSNAYKGLTTIIIEEGILEIGEKAFYGCKDLEEVEIPKTTKITNAFEECDAVITIV